MNTIITKKSSKNVERYITISKIIIIILAGVYLLGNFTPYFEGKDSYLYGIEAVNFSNGIYSISNELLAETGRMEFVGDNYRKTIHGDAIPSSGIGTPVLGTIAYVIAGQYGLFYLGPILGIILLIIYERISVNLFGKYAGFITFLFFASCHIFFRSSVLINTDSIALLFFVPGVYYLIKFLKEQKEQFVLLSSTFFVIFSFVKIPGIVFLPIEVALIIGFYVITCLMQKNVKRRINREKIFRISIYCLIPWIVFFGFWLSYNDYFYGGPFTTYLTVKYGIEISSSQHISTLLKLENRDFEQFKDYSKYLLPYQIPAIYNNLENNYSDVLGKHWPGIITPILIGIAMLFSFVNKEKRIEILVLTGFIIGVLWFYSGQSSEERASVGLPARFMLPALSLSFMIFGYMIVKILRSEFLNRGYKKILKKIIIVTLGVFFLIAFYFTPPIQIFVDDTINFKNPVPYAEKYPLDYEVITKNSVIVSHHNDWAVDYGAIPFVLHYQHEINPDSVELLKDIIKNGREAYIFKQPTVIGEKDTINFLREEYGFVFKDESKTFCKIYVNSEDISDETCLNYEE